MVCVVGRGATGVGIGSAGCIGSTGRGDVGAATGVGSGVHCGVVVGVGSTARSGTAGCGDVGAATGVGSAGRGYVAASGVTGVGCDAGVAADAGSVGTCGVTGVGRDVGVAACTGSAIENDLR